MDRSVTLTSPAVLFADDDPMFRLILRSFLVEQGFEPIEAADGEEAVALFLARRPPLVLLDGQMPKLDGFAACRRIRESDPNHHASVLLLTGLEEESWLKDAEEAGADELIVKPIYWPELRQRIHQLLAPESGAVTTGY